MEPVHTAMPRSMSDSESAKMAPSYKAKTADPDPYMEE